MTEQEQQIALCEWMGWSKQMVEDGLTFSDPKQPLIVERWVSPNGYHTRTLPDTSSLDVLHEMEKRLLGHRQRNCSASECRDNKSQREWEVNLYNVIRRDDKLPNNYLIEMYRCANASATQRREALLRTLGLWKDDK